MAQKTPTMYEFIPKLGRSATTYYSATYGSIPISASVTVA
jgi:hypothetical protein